MIKLLPLLFLSSISVAKEQVVLTPQFVINKVLENGLEKKQIELDAQKSEIQIGQAESVFDSGMSLTTGYSIDQTENLSGISNEEDRNFITTIQYSKMFSTGTTLTAGIERIQQSSVLSSFTSTIRPETLTQNKISLEISQNLINNGFGVVNRNKLKQAKLQVESSYLLSEEKLEDLVLDTLQAFWNTYIAKESLNEAIKARKLIKDLESTIAKKSRMGNASPGELPRIQAEYETQNQRVKQASTDYINALQMLIVKMNMPMDTDAEVDVNHELPPIPEKISYKPETNRHVLIADKSINASELNLQNSESQSKPELTMNFQTYATGVDEDNDRSFSEMTAYTKPYYYLGFGLRFYLNSSLTEASIVNDRVHLQYANANRQQMLNNINLQLESAYRNILALHQIAKSTKKTVKLRERAAKEMDRAFKQGRLELDTLISGYRELFGERVKLAQANGNYRIAINNYAAARDQLIETKKIKR